jgi:hypothetical protein
MKHATAQTLIKLEPLLSRLRELPAIVERTPGSFYQRSRAYLHFHEDAAGLFADVKITPGAFTRLRVTTAKEQAHLLSIVAQSVEASAASQTRR